MAMRKPPQPATPALNPRATGRPNGRPKFFGEKVEDLIAGARSMGGYQPGMCNELMRTVRACWQVMTTKQRLVVLYELQDLLRAAERADRLAARKARKAKE